ncbi:MAG: MBL fold metallo-hydrolase [Vicinamibacteria bacterium]|nr:MBL fold metallo-hydrolase [Vicinamibacteria bacterium]
MITALLLAGALASGDEGVRAAREEFNAAIARRDAVAIGRLLAPGYHIVTGRSDQSHGARVEAERWAARFASDPAVAYRRSPREVRVNEAWGLAEETGDWTGSFTSGSSRGRAAGVYAAKWQRALDGRWLIQSEVFTTMSCEGPAAACPPPDPIEEVKAGSAGRLAHPAQKLKITVLSTMLTSGQGVGEWGFAALVEADGKRWLIDTGARAETVLRNATELGIELSDITDVVLTHNHADHTGGLLTLRRELAVRNPKALSRAHVGAGIFEPRLQPDGKDANGLRPLVAAYEASGGVFVVHDGAEELSPGVWFTGPVPRVHSERNWSGSLKVRTGGGLAEDTVAEDSAIVIETGQGLVIVTGCGHAGIVNIVDHARKTVGGASVHAVIGGLHLFPASDEQLAWTAARLREAGLVHLLGAHCTGIEAVFRLRDLANLSRRTAVVAAVGASFTLGPGIDPLALAR